MSLQENLAGETVDKLNLREALTIAPEAKVREAVSTMRNGNLGCVVVVDDEHKPVGLFTEAMLRLAICRNPCCVDASVAEHMATAYPWVATDDTIDTVLESMEAKNHRFVVVVDADHRVVGLTGQKGLMEYVAEHFPEEVMVQRVGTKPYPATREGA